MHALRHVTPLRIIRPDRQHVAPALSALPTLPTSSRRNVHRQTPAQHARRQAAHDQAQTAKHDEPRGPLHNDWLEPINSMRRQNEALRLKCTVFNSRGKATLGTQVFARSSFCSAHSLQSRDLRKIDTNVDNSVPTMLVRRGGILVNILYIRVLIKHDSLWLIDTATSAHSRSISAFVKTLQDTLTDSTTDSGLPFEFKALEAVLSSAVRSLEDEWREARTNVSDTLSKLEDNINASHLRLLLEHTRQMAVVQKRVVALRELIDDLLSDDEGLSDMYLTRQATGHHTSDEHAEVEQLLESYGTQVEETENAVQALTDNVQQTRDVIELILDSSRNALLALDLRVSIITASITAGALIAAFFGMNLATGLEDSVSAFVSAAGASLALTTFLALGMLRRLRKLRRIGLGTGTFGQLPSKHKRRYRAGEEVFLPPGQRRDGAAVIPHLAEPGGDKVLRP